nr:DUF4375 domain-containing protein [Sphingomonas populi]
MSMPILLPEGALDEVDATVESFFSLVDAAIPGKVRWNTDGTDEVVNLYHALQYEGEVNNGGHDQYFHNQNGHTPVYVSALAGLRLIGALPYAELVEAMLSWAEDHPEETHGTLDSPVSPTLERLDERFFEISEERLVRKLVQEWLRRSPEVWAVPYDEFWATVFRYQGL